MRFSIRFQLLIPLGILLLGVIGMSTWTAASSADRAWRQIEEQMNHVAETMNNVKFPRNAHTLGLMKGLSGAEFLVYQANGGAHAADSSAITTLPQIPANLPPPVAHGAASRLGPRVEMEGQVYFCRGVYLGEDKMWILYIFYPESLWQGALWAAIRPSLYLGLFGGLASIVLAVAVSQRFSRRVQELELRTRRIAAGDFSPMALPRRNDEIRDLAKSVNEMAQRLAQLRETVKQTERLRLLGQVSSGLAHQLRNGVTGARLAVQLHVRELNGQADFESLQVALRQLALVELHLKRFLGLGRLEELRREPCDLIGLIDETVSLVQPKCRHANIDLQWQVPQDATGFTLPGDFDQLQHVLLNVVTNAIEAAGPEGRVRIELGRNADCIVIDVSDTGPGPDPEIAGRLFEAFVTGKREGVGLGLAISRQVIEAHQGTIRWTRGMSETVFHIELPASVEA